jgi:putative membrane protein
MMHGMNYGHVGVGSFSFLPILLGILLVVLIIRLIMGPRRFHRGWYNNFNDNSALTLLKERYAKGEINKQEFEEKKKDLM